MEGCLHPANVLMCPHTCITNLPKPREVHPDVGPASVIVGNLVQGNRLGIVSNNMSIEAIFLQNISLIYLILFYEKNSMASNIVGLLTKYLGVMEIFT